MSDSISLEDLIIQMMPFASELVEWCKTHPEFQSALKPIYAGKFVSLGAIVTSYSPNFPKDEVIGIYVYDYSRKNPLFKQDFIVNKDKVYKEFVLYTRVQDGKSSKYVKDINEFYTTYGNGGYYINSHHLSLEQLPVELQERGQQAIKLANKLKGGFFIKPDQAHIDKVHGELILAKKGEWWVKKKLGG